MRRRLPARGSPARRGQGRETGTTVGNTWFTSDTHFGHGRIIESCKRPFADSAHMDAEIIRRWNLAVAPADTVWVLGDWALGDKVRGLEIVSELHGTKHPVAGNRDACWPGASRGGKAPGGIPGGGLCPRRGVRPGEIAGRRAERPGARSPAEPLPVPERLARRGPVLPVSAA